MSEEMKAVRAAILILEAEVREREGVIAGLKRVLGKGSGECRGGGVPSAECAEREEPKRFRLVQPGPSDPPVVARAAVNVLENRSPHASSPHSSSGSAPEAAAIGRPMGSGRSSPTRALIIEFVGANPGKTPAEIGRALIGKVATESADPGNLITVTVCRMTTMGVLEKDDRGGRFLAKAFKPRPGDSREVSMVPGGGMSAGPAAGSNGSGMKAQRKL